jgi:hypothetical protein
MKNALFLVGIWVGIIFFAYGVVYLPPDRTMQVERAGDVETVDDLRGVAFPLPAGWAFRPTDVAGVFLPPVAGIEAWTVRVLAQTTDEALAAAWEAIDPCSSCAVPATLASMPLGGGRDGAVLDLAQDAEGRTARAVVLLLGDSARVFLSRRAADVELPARVEEGLARIETGLHAIESAPLDAAASTGLEPAESRALDAPTPPDAVAPVAP